MTALTWPGPGAVSHPLVEGSSRGKFQHRCVPVGASVDSPQEQALSGRWERSPDMSPGPENLEKV